MANRKILWALTVLGLFLLSLRVIAERPTTECGWAEAPFTPDGILEDDEWRSAAVVDISISGRSANAYFMNDEENLMVGVEVLFDTAVGSWDKLTLYLDMDNDADLAGSDVYAYLPSPSDGVTQTLWLSHYGWDTGATRGGVGVASADSGHVEFEYAIPITAVVSADRKEAGFALWVCNDGMPGGCPNSLTYPEGADLPYHDDYPETTNWAILALADEPVYQGPWHVDPVNGVDTGYCKSRTTWEDPSYPPYQSLQSAINCARYTPVVDDIYVAEGSAIALTGTETIQVLSQVSLYGGVVKSDGSFGQNFDNPTVIDGQGYTRHCVTVVSPTVTIDGFTITGGNARLTDPFDNREDYTQGGGIYVGTFGPVVIANSVITGNIATDAMPPGGYQLPTNEFYGSGAGVFAPYFSTVTITNSELTNNAAVRGGGIYGQDGGFLKVHNSTFSGNTASQDGGAIYSRYNYLNVSGSLFVGNSASSSGGGLFDKLNTSNISDSEFRDNYAGVGGGGVYRFESSGDISRCWFEGNSTSTNGGAISGGFNDPDDRSTTVANSIFLNNGANDAGGAIWAYAASDTDPSIDLVNCTLVGNSAKFAGAFTHLTTVYTVANTIAVSNTATYADCGTGYGDEQICQDGITIPNYYHNMGRDADSQGWFIGKYPSFVDGPHSDLRLDPSSLGINAGIITDTIPLPLTDYAGNNRVIAGNIDVGAYETLLQNQVWIVGPGGGVFYDPFTGVEYTFGQDAFGPGVAVEVTHRPDVTGPVPIGDVMVGFEVNATITQTNEIAIPTGTYTLTVRMSDQEMQEYLQNGGSLQYWTAGTWIEEDATADDNENTVTANPDHMSFWAVFVWRRLYLPLVLR